MTIPSTEMQKQRYSRELAAYTLRQWDNVHPPADNQKKSEVPPEIQDRNANNHESQTHSRRTTDRRLAGTLLCHFANADEDSLVTIDRLAK